MTSDELVYFTKLGAAATAAQPGFFSRAGAGVRQFGSRVAVVLNRPVPVPGFIQRAGAGLRGRLDAWSAMKAKEHDRMLAEIASRNMMRRMQQQKAVAQAQPQASGGAQQPVVRKVN